MSSNRRMSWWNLTRIIMVGLLLTGKLAVADEGAVRIAEEKVVLPTYEIGPADPNPMFYTNESYQGAQKRIYREAEKHLRTAAERLSSEYTRSRNTEALYQLGIALRAQHKDDEAYEAFYRATWDQAFHTAAYYQLAEISTSRGNYAQAVDQVNRSLSTGTLDTKALALKAGILRKLRRGPHAEKAAAIALKIDPLDFRAMNELWLAEKLQGNQVAAKAALDRTTRKMRDEVQAYLELAADYFAAGMWDEAVAVLRRPIDSKTSFAATYPLVHYYLGWAYYRVKNDVARAIGCYERALACGDLDPRLFLELDILYEFGNVAPEQRLAALEPNHEIVVKRQDSFLREIMVLVLTGKYDRAIDYLENNFFHAQEGRNEIRNTFVDAHLLEGLRLMKAGQPREALAHFLRAGEYPENLSVGRPKTDPRSPQIDYCAATAHAALGDADKARQFFRRSADRKETARRPEARFYQAMSLSKLDRKDEARTIYDELVETGKRQLAEDESADFFAKFGEQKTRKSKAAAAHHILGLGFLGQGRTVDAQKELQQATQMNLSHPWAAYHATAPAQN